MHDKPTQAKDIVREVTNRIGWVVGDLSDDEIPIDIELGSAGLYYGTSPAMKGLLVTGNSIKELMERVPNAVAELKAVAATAEEIERLNNALKEAREIIGAFYTEVSIEGQRHIPHALTTRANGFLNKDHSNG